MGLIKDIKDIEQPNATIADILSINNPDAWRWYNKYAEQAVDILWKEFSYQSIDMNGNMTKPSSKLKKLGKYARPKEIEYYSPYLPKKYFGLNNDEYQHSVLLVYRTQEEYPDLDDLAWEISDSLKNHNKSYFDKIKGVPVFLTIYERGTAPVVLYLFDQNAMEFVNLDKQMDSNEIQHLLYELRASFK